jgi:hypothetical protein
MNLIYSNNPLWLLNFFCLLDSSFVTFSHFQNDGLIKVFMILHEFVARSVPLMNHQISFSDDVFVKSEESTPALNFKNFDRAFWDLTIPSSLVGNQKLKVAMILPFWHDLSIKLFFQFLP